MCQKSHIKCHSAGFEKSLKIRLEIYSGFMPLYIHQKSSDKRG